MPLDLRVYLRVSRKFVMNENIKPMNLNMSQQIKLKVLISV